MPQTELLIPRMGESVFEATIIKWLKNEGDRVALDEPILEIATDKVDSEIPSMAEGILVKKLFKEGEVVQVGKPVALISSDSEAAVTSSFSDALPIAQSSSPPAVNRKKGWRAGLPASVFNNGETNIPVPVSESVSAEKLSAGGRFYSPLVKNIAKQESISPAELETIAGTGKEGRVTKQDILSYLPKRKKEISSLPSAIPSAQVDINFGKGEDKKVLPFGEPARAGTDGDLGGAYEIIEMDRMRKLIAEHMVMSKRTSPHVTSYIEADVTNLVKWRTHIKDAFEKREGEKSTFTPVFIEAVAKAIKDFPMVNVSVEGTKIILHKNINIGIAVALPSGNLIVPVIKNADRYNLLGLAKTVNDLAARARSGKLLPDEIQGGTFTITNIGVFGNVAGASIINQPQVAILATGVIRKKPVVKETEFGDAIVIRQMMYLSLSYDHRVVDGMLGGNFLARIVRYLEKFDANKII